VLAGREHVLEISPARRTRESDNADLNDFNFRLHPTSVLAAHAGQIEAFADDGKEVILVIA